MITMIEFITEQNRIDRTGGLPITHPEGKVMPCDVPMSSDEIIFLEAEDEMYKKMVQEWFNE